MALTDKLGTPDSTPGNLTAGEGAPEAIAPLVTLSQVVVEMLSIPPAPTVISQLVIETLFIGPAPTVISQFLVEALVFDPVVGGGLAVGAFAGEVGGPVWIE